MTFKSDDQSNDIEILSIYYPIVYTGYDSENYVL